MEKNIFVTCICLAMVLGMTSFVCSEGGGSPSNGDKENDDDSVARDSESALRKKLYAGHDLDVRPERKVIVDIGLVLMRINNLGTRDQTMASVGLLIVEWNDGRLTWNSSEFNVDVLFVTSVQTWTPLMLIANEVQKFAIISDPTAPMMLTNDGRLLWTPPLLMDTSCELDILFYPADVQVCSIMVTSFAHADDEFEFRAQTIDTVAFVQNGEWNLDAKRITVVKELRVQRNMSGVEFTFVLRRKPTHYILNAIVPAILMSFLAPLVFKLPERSGERISYVITVFLAVVVMLTLILDQLPPSSRVPSLFSIYLATTTVLSALTVPFTINNLILHHNGSNAPESGISYWIGLCLKKGLRKRLEQKIRPSDDKDTNCENILKDKADTERMNCEELAGLLDKFYFLLFTGLTAGLALLFIVLLISQPQFMYTQQPGEFNDV